MYLCSLCLYGEKYFYWIYTHNCDFYIPLNLFLISNLIYFNFNYVSKLNLFSFYIKMLHIPLWFLNFFLNGLFWVFVAAWGLSLVAESKGYSLGAVHWLLIVVTSLLGILVPGPGIESMFLALAGIFLTTGLPGKSVPHCDF